MPTIRRQDGCCGVRELFNLGALSKTTILRVAQAIREESLNAAYYMFADRASNGNGARLARYIKKHELGDLIETPPTHNPQSGHDLIVWLWKLDQDAIAEYAQNNS